MAQVTSLTRAAPALVHGRCDPYGHERGGPRHLLGGLYGPEHEGRVKWTCERPAGGRFRMECRCEHRGQPMALCLPGLERDGKGELFAHPGHVASIQGRQAAACPKCLFPPEAAELAKAAETCMQELARFNYMGLSLHPTAIRLHKIMGTHQARLDELNALGIIHRCPLTLVEIS